MGPHAEANPCAVAHSWEPSLKGLLVFIQWRQFYFKTASHPSLDNQHSGLITIIKYLHPAQRHLSLNFEQSIQIKQRPLGIARILFSVSIKEIKIKLYSVQSFSTSRLRFITTQAIRWTDNVKWATLDFHMNGPNVGLRSVCPCPCPIHASHKHAFDKGICI